jgi:hypothetical protein
MKRFNSLFTLKLKFEKEKNFYQIAEFKKNIYGPIWPACVFPLRVFLMDWDNPARTRVVIKRPGVPIYGMRWLS